MKVFLFKVGTYKYAVSGNTQEEAHTYLLDYTGFDHIESAEVEEIPESKWDERNITMYEDNDTETEPFYMTIREMMEKEPSIIYTNDNDLC